MGAAPEHHAHVLGQLQRLRGHVYLRDGALEPRELTPDGRHVLPIDQQSWHLVSVQDGGRVTGCARYRVHDTRVAPEDLAIWSAAVAQHPKWRHELRHAVAGEIDRARRGNVVYVEVGGWAIAEDRRFTPAALDVALSTYALARTLGGCVGITTATTRNRSSSILRKIGGEPLGCKTGTVPCYYDPQYRCEMELLRFDSGALNPRFDARIDRIQSQIADCQVLCATDDRVLTPRPARPRARPKTIAYLPARACA